MTWYIFYEIHHISLVFSFLNRNRNAFINRIVIYFRSKPHSPHETQDKFIIQRAIMTRQPFSSGSDSSGYFTPPADPPGTSESQHPPSRNSSSHSERFIKLDTPKHSEENFTILDTEEDPEPIIAERSHTLQVDQSFDESKSDDDSKFDEPEEFDGKENLEVIDASSLVRNDSFNFDEIDFQPIQEQNNEQRIWSKSEIDLNISPEVNRKGINSAPIENLKAIEYKPFHESPIDTPKTSVPGSIDLQDMVPEEEFICPVKKIIRKIKPPLLHKFSSRTPRKEKCLETLRSFTKPREGLYETLTQLNNGEWEMMIKGLQGLRRLIRYHPETVESSMHSICVALGKHIRNLRSQVARAACSVASEMFNGPKRSLEMVRSC